MNSPRRHEGHEEGSIKAAALLLRVLRVFVVNFFSKPLLLLALLALLLYAASRSELIAPAPSTLLTDRHGAFLAEWGGDARGEHGYWPVEPLPERVAAAVVAIEDRRFQAHPGVDPLAIGRALWQRLDGGRSGASTIAMQVARMQQPASRHLGAKLGEALAALALTARHGRAAVLAHYLRLVPFGNGSHGIAHAARLYLDKPVADLSWGEIAFLMAIPQSPARMNPTTVEGRGRAIQRGRRILTALARDGVLSGAELALAEAQIGELPTPPRPARPEVALHAVLGMSHGDFGTGLVAASLDLGVQNEVATLAEATLAELRPLGAEHAAVMVIDRSSREVLAQVGSAGYRVAGSGAIDFTRRLRSPGSTLKPFIYALALERGRIAGDSVLADLPGRSWGIGNFDHRFLGPMLPRQALANSRNVPAADVLRQVGVEETYGALARLGLHGAERTAGYYGAALAIGAMPTTLEKLLTAYGALADDGVLAPLVWTRGGSSGRHQRLWSTATARQITLFLADAQARLPSFPRLGPLEYPFPVAAKTGTSQGYRDAWTVAWSRRFLVGVWIGRADARPMRGIGGTRAAELARTVMLRLHEREAIPSGDLAFPPPAGWHPAEVCARTGGRNVGLCDSVLTEWFAADTLPDEDERYRRLRIDRRTGLRAASWTPAEHVSERVFVSFDPVFVGWGVANGLLPPPDRPSPLDAPADAVKPRGRTLPVLSIISPADRLRLIRNPETPEAMNVIALRTAAVTGVDEVTWLVDGRLYAAARPGSAIPWPLTPGTHRFQVSLPDGSALSEVVTVTVE